MQLPHGETFKHWMHFVVIGLVAELLAEHWQILLNDGPDHSKTEAEIVMNDGSMPYHPSGLLHEAERAKAQRQK